MVIRTRHKGWLLGLALAGFCCLGVRSEATSAIYTDKKLWVAPITDAYPKTAKPLAFGKWLRSKEAVLTPEITHIGLETVLERTREQLDRFAYELVRSLAKSLAENENFSAELLKNARNHTGDLGIARLTFVLGRLLQPNPISVADLSERCNKVFKELDYPALLQLSYVYGGHLNLSGMESQNDLIQHPFWQRLRQATCHVNGYVAASTRPEVWKYWMAYHLLSWVLPTDADSADFVNRMSRDPKIAEWTGRIDSYMAFRGKPIGHSLKMAIDHKREHSDYRYQGKFRSSTAVSLLADYGSYWQEAVLGELKPEDLLKDGVPSQDRTLELGALFDNLPNNYNSRPSSLTRSERYDPSAFEIGLVFWWKRIKEPTQALVYGDSTHGYVRASSAQWWSAILDGFSIHSHWSDVLAADSDSKEDPQCCTRNVMGATVYADLAYELEMALKGFDPAIEASKKYSRWTSLKAAWIDAFNTFKKSALGLPLGTVGQLDATTTNWWSRVSPGIGIGYLGAVPLNRGVTKKTAHIQLARGASGRVITFEQGKTLWQPDTYIVIQFSESTDPNMGLSAEEWKKLVEERGL